MKKATIAKMLVWCLILVGTLVASLGVSAEQPSPSPPPPISARPEEPEKAKRASPSEEELLKARKENEEAQAKYYKKLWEKLEEKIPEKSFMTRVKQSIADNPASVLGVLGAFAAFVGALIAARITFLSFLFNYYATVKNQSDTQFYESLKRFGDKDSPSTRANAAGMLAIMGQAQIARLEEPTFWSRVSSRRKVERPYLVIAVNQLLVGLVLEQNEAVIAAIKTAMARLIPLDREGALDGLYRVNLDLQEGLLRALAAYLTTQNVSQWSAVNEIVLSRAAALSSFKSTTQLRDFAEKFEQNRATRWGKDKNLRPPNELTGYLKEISKAEERQGIEKSSENTAAITNNLRVAANRLHVNAELLTIALNGGSAADAGLDDVFLD